MSNIVLQHLPRQCRRLVLASLALPGLALAALPKAETPSRGQGSNLIQTFQNYGFDIAMLIGLIICVVAFMGVGWHSFGIYHEIQHGKKKWSELGASVAVGIGILIAIIYLVTKATTIL